MPYFLVALAVIAAVMAGVGLVIKNSRANNPKRQQQLADFQQSVTAQLQPGEVLEAYCGYNPCVAVSSQRIFVGTKKELVNFPYGYVTKAEGMDGGGRKTTDTDFMLCVTLKLVDGRRYTFGNQSAGFEEVLDKINCLCGFY